LGHGLISLVINNVTNKAQYNQTSIPAMACSFFSDDSLTALSGLQMLQVSSHDIVARALREITDTTVKKNAIIRRMSL
jgi:hypothetical protein